LVLGNHLVESFIKLIIKLPIQKIVGAIPPYKIICFQLSGLSKKLLVPGFTRKNKLTKNNISDKINNAP
jgi:hypothetical protein